MPRIGLALLVLMRLGTAHAAPCTQPLPVDYHAQLPEGSALAAPRNVRLAIAHADNAEWLTVDGDFDPRAKYIGVEIGGYTMLTTPDFRSRCTSELGLNDEPYEARIFTVDADGKRSEAVTKDVMVIGARHEVPYRCGLFILAYFAATLVGLVVLVLVMIGAGIYRASMATTGEIMSAVLAENVTREVARRAQIKLACSVVAPIVLWSIDHPFVALIIGPLALAYMHDAIRARFVLRQFTKLMALQKRGNWIHINGHKLYAPGRIWRKASSLPTAGLA